MLVLWGHGVTPGFLGCDWPVVQRAWARSDVKLANNVRLLSLCFSILMCHFCYLIASFIRKINISCAPSTLFPFLLFSFSSLIGFHFYQLPQLLISCQSSVYQPPYVLVFPPQRHLGRWIGLPPFVSSSDRQNIKDIWHRWRLQKRFLQTACFLNVWKWLLFSPNNPNKLFVTSISFVSCLYSLFPIVVFHFSLFLSSCPPSLHIKVLHSFVCTVCISVFPVIQFTSSLPSVMHHAGITRLPLWQRVYMNHQQSNCQCWCFHWGSVYVNPC